MDADKIDKESFRVLDSLIENSLSNIKEIELKLNNLNNIHQILKKIRFYNDKEWFLHLLELTKNEHSTLNVIQNENPELKNLILNIEELASDSSKKSLKNFPLLMEQHFNSIKPSLDKTSKHPKYTFEDGFFQLLINETTRYAIISDYEGKLAELPADIDAIKENIQKEYNRVFERIFDGKKFLQKLRNNYLAIISKTNKIDGDVIPIRSITQRLGKNEKKFRTDEFLIDLTRLVNEGPTELNNMKFNIQQTKDINQGMLLHKMPGGGYIGYLSFRKVQ